MKIWRRHARNGNERAARIAKENKLLSTDCKLMFLVPDRLCSYRYTCHMSLTKIYSFTGISCRNKCLVSLNVHSLISILELFSKQKGCVSSWIIHSPLPDRILYANCPIYICYLPAGIYIYIYSFIWLHLLFYVVLNVD